MAGRIINITQQSSNKNNSKEKTLSCYSGCQAVCAWATSSCTDFANQAVFCCFSGMAMNGHSPPEPPLEALVKTHVALQTFTNALRRKGPYLHIPRLQTFREPIWDVGFSWHHVLMCVFWLQPSGQGTKSHEKCQLGGITLGISNLVS